MLTKQQAAAHLSVSIRSLERYTAVGRIAARYEKGRSKPTPFYREDDLDQLKAALDEKRPTVTLRTPVSRPIVAFRLPEHYFDQLCEDGLRHSMSPGEYARHRLIDLLEAREGHRSEVDNTLLLRGIEKINSDLRTAVLGLLLFGGRIESENEAREWIATKMHVPARNGRG